MKYCITHVLDPKREYAMKKNSWEELKMFFKPDDEKQLKFWEAVNDVSQLRVFLQTTIYGAGNIVPFQILEILD